MQQIITFHVGKETKKEIKDFAESQGLDTASFCRNLVLKHIHREEEQKVN